MSQVSVSRIEGDELVLKHANITLACACAGVARASLWGEERRLEAGSEERQATFSWGFSGSASPLILRLSAVLMREASSLWDTLT